MNDFPILCPKTGSQTLGLDLRAYISDKLRVPMLQLYNMYKIKENLWDLIMRL